MTSRKTPPRREAALRRRAPAPTRSGAATKAEPGIRNPFARPRSCLRPVRAGRPAIVERPDLEAMARFAYQRGLELSGENPRAWRIWHRCVYASGLFDRICRVSDFAADSREEAIEALRERMTGFDVERVIVFRVDRPQTTEEIEQIHQINAALGLGKNKEESPDGGTEGGHAKDRSEADGEPLREPETGRAGASDAGVRARQADEGQPGPAAKDSLFGVRSNAIARAGRIEGPH